MQFYKNPGNLTNTGWFTLTNNNIVPDPVTSSLEVYLSVFDSTSTANFTSGTNAANTTWVDISSSGTSRDGYFDVFSGSNAFNWDATNKIITTKIISTNIAIMFIIHVSCTSIRIIMARLVVYFS